MIVNKYKGGGSSSAVTPEQVQQEIQSALTPYWESGITKEYVDSADTIVYASATSRMDDVEEIVSSALNEFHEQIMEVSAATSEIELPIAAAVNKLKGDFEVRLDQQYYKKKEVNDIAARKVEAGQVNVQIQDYVDPAIAEVNETITDKELPISAALNELNQKISEISGGSGGDMSAYWTSAQTEDAISAATSGKADKPLRETHPLAVSTLHINSGNYDLVLNGNYGQNIGQIWAPRSNGQAGQILVAQGGQTSPEWSAVTFPDVTNYVTSADVETQIVEKNYITSADTANMVSSTSISTIWKGTQAEYDLITTKDPNTFYIIVNN